MKVEFIVHTGDIVMNEIENSEVVEKSLSVMGQLKAPMHYIAGNHDILAGDKRKTTANIYKNRYSPLYDKAEYKGIVFLFMYSIPLAEGFVLEGYEPLEWLKQTLEESADKPVIIFHHVPSVEDFYNNQMHNGWPEAMRQQWTTLLNSHNVKAVIAGHFHRDEHHWLGEVPLYVSGPVAGYWGRQATFRVFEYRNGKISYRTQYIQ